MSLTPELMDDMWLAYERELHELWRGVGEGFNPKGRPIVGFIVHGCAEQNEAGLYPDFTPIVRPDR